MANQYINKVIVGGDVKLDLTEDTITADKLLSGHTTHDKSGAPIEGTCQFNVDARDANAAAAEILAGKTAYVGSSKVTGTMPNKGAVKGAISEKDETYKVPQGFHDGSGTVGLSAEAKATILASNIKSGVDILGVTGTYQGELVSGQEKTVTPTFAAQTIVQDEGFDYLAKVVVSPIPVSEVDNAQGGKTLTIGG